MRKIIALLMAFGMFATTATFATGLTLTVFDNPTIIDGHVFQNQSLQYPFLKDDDSIYMPLDYQTLRTLGYLSAWNDETNTFRIYTTANRSYNIRPSEVEWSSSDISAIQTGADLSWMDDKTIQSSLYQANGVLYLKLTDDVLKTFDWAAAYHPLIGLQMSVEADSSEFVEVDEAVSAYYDGLARFMMTRNGNLSYEKAMEYVSYVREASKTNDIDEVWIMAMLWQESSYNSADEYKGAIGLMQIMESTGRALGLTREQLFDPELSIKYGVKYLRDQMNAFDNDLKLATLAYNQGPIRVQRGTYKTWYLDQVSEKAEVIKTWLKENAAYVDPQETGSAE